MNCSSDLKKISNSRTSASNFKSFSWSLEQFFLTVGQNNFGNKIPFILLFSLVFFPKLAASFLGQMIARTLVSFARPNIFHAKQWHYCPNNWGVSYSLFGYRVCIAIVGTKLITVLALLFKEMSLCTCKKILYDQKFFFRMIVMFFVLLDALST